MKLSRILQILLFGMLLCTGRVAHAQEDLHYVQVELNSGVKMKAQLVSISYGDSIEIKTPDGSNMVVPWDDIAELNFIDKEVEKAVTEPRRIRQEHPFKDKDWGFSFDFGTNFGADYYGDPVMGGTIQAGVHKRFNSRTHLGLVSGAEFYLWPDMMVVPLALEYKGRFKNEGFSWFYFLQVGHGFVPFSEYNDGWLLNGKAWGGTYFSPGLGFVNKWNPNRSWYMRFGYKFQEAFASYDGSVWTGGVEAPVHVEETIRYHRIEIKLGYEFDLTGRK